MTDQEPQYLSQGVNYLGFLAQQLGDLRGNTTLAHELIQNADDAKDDSGNLCATEVIFDVRDDALVVSNDAVFRQVDFDRLRAVASGSKRTEDGVRTTGAFGVGFISVYQITDQPEIRSAGRHWVLRPDNREDERIAERPDPSMTKEKGTRFRLPWAFKQSQVRQALKAPTVDETHIESFVEELQGALPRAMLFLKQLRRIALLRNGDLICQVRRDFDEEDTLIDHNGSIRCWRVFTGDFQFEASQLRDRYGDVVENNRSSVVRIAVPDSPVADGLLFATLPTEQSTGLPFHIDADFFPASDRKSIAFGDSYDPRSEWNRAALKAAASVVAANLISIRDTLGQDAADFWRFLDALYKIHGARGSDAQVPLGAFWQSLTPSLPSSPIVRSAYGEWLKPSEVRIPTGREEESAVRTFGELGIGMVSRNLWSYRNVLTSGPVGVKRLTVDDIADALRKMGLVTHAQPLPSSFQSREALESLWLGIKGVLDNTQGRSAQSFGVKLLGECTLALGRDGRLWPCHSAIYADEQTRSVFAGCLPEGVTLTVEDNIPLLRRICPPLSPEVAICLLEQLTPDDLQARWMGRDLDPSRLLRWFDANKSELNDDLRDRLAKLPIFPSAQKLRSLRELWLPGGFDDPMGSAGLLDMGVLSGLSDFLEYLGARKLTFENYAMRYIAADFTAGRRATIQLKGAHLANLERHIGQIRSNLQLREKLAATNIVECTDGDFRMPSGVYFPCKKIREVMGNRVSYAMLSESAAGRRDLYAWLGVAAQTRVRDLLQVIEGQTAHPPTDEARSTVVKMLEALWSAWPGLDGREKAYVNSLRDKQWLPAEGDGQRWYKPDQLYAVYNKHFFASQASFFDAPVLVQRSTSALLQSLGMQSTPRPVQVVDHLLWCVERQQEPPGGIYRWLDDNAKPEELERLSDEACLWTGTEYLSPTKCYRGQHSFGRFRSQLGPNLLSRQNLIQALGVKEAPGPSDAIDVLREVSDAVGHDPLTEEDHGVVLQCWVELSNVLQGGLIGVKPMAASLRDIPSVPNEAGLLQKSDWVFFEDRPGLRAKFPDLLAGNCIPKQQRVWRAMEAAGVRQLSAVIRSHHNDLENQVEVAEIQDRILERIKLVRAILEPSTERNPWDAKGIPVGNVRFFRADKLTITWELDAFGRIWPRTSPESVQAHLDVDQEAIYFTLSADGTYPWSAIAREMTCAVAPHESIGAISPGLRMVLEAETFEDAIGQAEELGITGIQGLGNVSNQGNTADLDDDDLPVDRYQGGFGASGDGYVSDDGSIDLPPASPIDAHQDVPPVPFAQKLYEVQTITSSRARQRQVFLPPGGPQTIGSARNHTQVSVQVGRSGSYVSRAISRWEPVEAANDLAEEFRAMVYGDYGQRCQICSRTFTLPGGSLQVYVVHVVPPSADHRTNHFGDLLGLCGWHYSLIRYGEWAFLDPETHQPFVGLDELEGWERLQNAVPNAPRHVDDLGNEYVGLEIRFSNVYEDWESDPTDVVEKVRYSIPHWTYLCQLLQA